MVKTSMTDQVGTSKRSHLSYMIMNSLALKLTSIGDPSRWMVIPTLELAFVRATLDGISEAC